MKLIAILLIAGTAFAATPGAIKVTFDPRQPGTPISPLIFGVSFPKDAHRDVAKIALERWGGNRWTRFDWKTGNSAAGHDWFWMNGGENAGSPDTLWYHAAITRNRAQGIETLVTIPTAGWVAKDNNSCSFPKAKFPKQEKFDPEQNRCGNGRIAAGFDAKGATIWKDMTADPAEAGKPAPPEYAAEFVKYLKEKHGPAGNSPRVHYALDNEPGLWNSTHRDIHPEPVGYDEMWAMTVKYANAIKDADPTAFVWGPVEWGWLGIKNSALDGKGPGGFNEAADSKAHGSDFFLRWYIRKLALHKQATGRLLVDVIDIHDYPEVYAGDDGRIVMGSKGWNGGSSPASDKARLLAARTWWDPTYKPAGGDQGTTWINEPMYLLRRVQQMIRKELPELKLAVTEWNFGGNPTINGVLTHALVFRALMAEGAYAAAEWGPPGEKDAAFQAYALFRNYDGKGGSFTGEFRDHESPDDLVTVFSALDRPAGVLRVVVVNADPDRGRTMEIAAGMKLRKGDVRTFTVAASAPAAIVPGLPKKRSKSAVTIDVSPYAVSLVEIPVALK